MKTFIERNIDRQSLESIALELVRRSTTEDPHEKAVLLEVNDLLATAISKLNPRERSVLHARMVCGMTLLEASKHLNACGRERIRQIEMRAIRNLKEMREIKIIEGVLFDDD